MGNIIRKLDETEIVKRPTLQATRMIVENCENIHLHYRNMRLEFSSREFYFFARMIREAEQCLTENFKAMQEEEYSVLSSSLELDEEPDYFPNRITAEANLGSVHFHYKNFRLELTKEEAIDFLNSMETAKQNLKKVKPKVEHVLLEDIDPFDGGHWSEENELGFGCHEQKEHIEHIEKVKKAILQGEHIRPIVVLPGPKPYKRMDGFCRYIAHKQLKSHTIETIICPIAYPGCQHRKNFIVSPEEYNKIHSGETY